MGQGANRHAGSIFGDVVELHPDKLNFMWHAVAGKDGSHSLTATTTIDYLEITPRWLVS